MWSFLIRSAFGVPDCLKNRTNRWSVGLSRGNRCSADPLIHKKHSLLIVVRFNFLKQQPGTIVGKANNRFAEFATALASSKLLASPCGWN
jgi:hypothetical protein